MDLRFLFLQYWLVIYLYSLLPVLHNKPPKNTNELKTINIKQQEKYSHIKQNTLILKQKLSDVNTPSST